MTDDGYRKYKKFFQSRPLLTLEWNDSETDSVGWLVINSLRGGAAGGGTRMREKATREEAVFLAKTMEVKFRISGPPIGGAKSVIKVSFDPRRDRAKRRDVLGRWFAAVRPMLSECYGTGGDLNVKEDEVKELTRLLPLSHPQEGIVRGHFPARDDGYYGTVFNQLNEGVEMRLPPPHASLTVANMITGYGLARSLRYYYELRGERLAGKRVLVEGFGEVGGSAAYYLEREGARVVGVLSLANAGVGSGAGGRRFSWDVNDDGLDVNDLLLRREENCLPKDCEAGSAADAEKFWKTEADIFVPAAASYTVDSSVIEKLKGAGVSTIACGSNVSFSFEAKRNGDRSSKDISEIKDIGEMADHSLTTQVEADREFGIIPDFIANCGMARVFAYLMNPGADVSAASIFEDTDETIRGIMSETLAGHAGGPGLLNHAYSLFIPDV